MVPKCMCWMTVSRPAYWSNSRNREASTASTAYVMACSRLIPAVTVVCSYRPLHSDATSTTWTVSRTSTAVIRGGACNSPRG